VQRLDRILPVGALGVIPNMQPLWAQLDALMTVLTIPRLGTERREPVQVGVVDQLAVRDHRTPIPWTVLRDNVFDGIKSLADR
ncbi:hypothetical protein C6A85_15040, partial [Mycobacterium sp. ITM-2017-0098]